jgi:hypothetical protein
VWRFDETWNLVLERTTGHTPSERILQRTQRAFRATVASAATLRPDASRSADNHVFRQPVI